MSGSRCGRPAYLKQQVELSLRNLRVDRIDLIQLHRVDPEVPLEDQVGAFAELQEQGKVRHIGLSEVSVEQLEQARAVTEIASVQNLYNLTNRQSQDVLDYATRENIAFIPWFPIATGDLAAPDSPVADIARELDASPSQVALAWLLADLTGRAADPRNQVGGPPAGEPRRRVARALRGRRGAADRPRLRRARRVQVVGTGVERLRRRRRGTPP